MPPLRELVKRVADLALKLIVGQQRSISELMKTCGPGRVAEDEPGRVAEDETGEDAAADDAAQFRQVDLGDLVQFAAVGITTVGAKPRYVLSASKPLGEWEQPYCRLHRLVSEECYPDF